MDRVRSALLAVAVACVAGDAAATSGKLVVTARAIRPGSVGVGYRSDAAGLEAPSRSATVGPRLRLQVHYADAEMPGALASGPWPAAVDSDGRVMLVADGFGGVPATDARLGEVSAALCLSSDSGEECRCATFAACDRQSVGSGRGVKLVCRHDTPDSTCAARVRRCLGAGDCLLDDWNRDGMGVVACAGDSNTFETPSERRWCFRLDEWLNGFETRLVAWPATRASDDQTSVLGSPVSSHVYLDLMLRYGPPPDIVVLAWGTNDVPVHSAEQIADAIDVLVAWMRRSGVVPVVATVPWRFERAPKLNAKVDAVNALLKARYGPCLVDFTTITPSVSAWYVDARHLNEAAQERRALAAYWALATLPRSCGAHVAKPVS